MNKMLSSHEPEHHAALNREQLLTFIQLRKKTYIPIGLVIIMTWALWGFLPPLYLFSWMGCVLLTVIPRYLMIPTSIEGLTAESIKQRTFLAWMLTMAYCAVWGVGAVVCIGLLPLMKQMMLIMLLVGLTGAVMGYVTDKKYSYGIHSLTVPLMLWLLTQDRGVYIEIGVMMVLYVLFMQFSLGSQHKRFTRSVMMRFENEVLLEQLQEQIEEKERVEQQLREKSKDADKANRAKTEFLSVVSHELRTPVHGLIGMLDLLKGVRMNKEAREDLKNARRAARSLRVLVNDILDLSKVEAGKMELRIEPFPIEECMHDVLMPCMMLAKKQGTKVAVDFEHVPSTIHADAGKLRQILINLIGNAVKFTERGTVLVHIEAKGTQRLAFSVQDTGVGMAKEDLASIFEPFVQLKPLMERQHDGTGLGISIADKFVQQMGGKLEVKSELGMGSTFSFELDCNMEGELVKRSVKMTDSQSLAVADDPEIDREEEAPKQATTAKKGGQTKWKVLVAEDDPISRRIAQKRLGRVGFEVTAAEDGSIAWDLLQKNTYDLILLDIRMPGMDGVSVARHVRQQENPNKDAPMIGLSAHATKQVMDECLSVGMNDFLMKPIEPAVIVQKMQALLMD